MENSDIHLGKSHERSSHFCYFVLGNFLLSWSILQTICYAFSSQMKKKKVLQKCNFSNAQCNEDKLFSLGRRRKQNRLLVPKAVQIESQ